MPKKVLKYRVELFSKYCIINFHPSCHFSNKDSIYPLEKCQFNLSRHLELFEFSQSVKDLCQWEVCPDYWACNHGAKSTIKLVLYGHTFGRAHVISGQFSKLMFKNNLLMVPTWIGKWENISNQGKVREFWTDWKSQGSTRKVREFYPKTGKWEICSQFFSQILKFKCIC